MHTRWRSVAVGLVVGVAALACGWTAGAAEPARVPRRAATAGYAQARTVAPSRAARTPAAGERPAAKSREDAGSGKEQINYIKVTAEELERFPRQFENRYVQVADFFEERLDRPPRVLRDQGISADAFDVFLTHRAVGSNMICVLHKKNEEAVAVLGTLVSESPIYLMGRVGPLVETDYGGRPIFLVDRLARGHEPPPPPKVREEKKPVLLVLDVPVVAPDGSKSRRRAGSWKITSPGKPYVIPDPYDKTKFLIITLEY